MPKLVTAILARNEAAPDRYLRRVIARCTAFSDHVLVLDDQSTDDTAQVARDAGCIVERFPDGAGFWGDTEVPARRYLWERAAKLAGDGWVLICDADMLLQGDVRALCATWECAAWAFPLADLWDSEETFRVDGPWGLGPTHPRPWLFRPSALQVAPEWPADCTIHVGHAPSNFGQAGPIFVAPSDVYWRHYSYLKPEHRAQKHLQYAKVAHTMSEFQRTHAESILDG